MKTRDLESQFNVIVNTLLSTQKVQPEIIRVHIARYATSAGITYNLAKQAVLLKAKAELLKRIEQI